MTIMDDTIAVLRGNGFEADHISSEPNFHAVVGIQNTVRVYFVWRKLPDSDSDYIFQIGRIIDNTDSQSLGTYSSVTETFHAAKIASTTT